MGIGCGRGSRTIAMIPFYGRVDGARRIIVERLGRHAAVDAELHAVNPAPRSDSAICCAAPNRDRYGEHTALAVCPARGTDISPAVGVNSRVSGS
jgi:hypothetical protein